MGKMTFVFEYEDGKARSVKLLATGEANRLGRNPGVAHVRHVHHIRIPRVNLHGITIAIAYG